MSEEKEQGMVEKAGGQFAGLIGLAVGVYSGVNLVIPAIGTWLSWLAAKKIFGESRKIVLPSFAFQAGHFFWLVVGSLLVGSLASTGLDLIVYILGLGWLLIRPSQAPLIFLCVVQALSLIVNGNSFLAAQFGSLPHKALLVHILWRGASIYFMVKAISELRKGQPQAEAAP